jgi:predicted small secreted protein
MRAVAAAVLLAGAVLLAACNLPQPNIPQLP